MSAVLSSSVSGRSAITVRSARQSSSLRLQQQPRSVVAIRRQVAVRAEGSGFNFEEAKDSYVKLTNSIPPVATAATVPVIGLSLLCKTLTGSGLPGTFLGSIEGLSYLLFIAGAGSFLPRASDIVKGGDFSTEGILEALNKPAPSGRSADPNDDVRGKSSTERVATMSKRVGSDNVFKAQMEDIEKAKKEKEAETPEIREMKEKLRQQLAVKAKIIEKADDE